MTYHVTRTYRIRENVCTKINTNTLEP